MSELPNEATVEVRIKGYGGKGGFGAQLRNAAKTQKKVTNFDSSRNRNGRRIRDANNEKNLRKWYKEKLERDKEIEKEMKEFKKFKKQMGHKSYKLTAEY